MMITAVSPKHRVSAYFFTIYMMPAILTAYGGIWFADMGLSNGQIAILNAAPILGVMVLNLLVGRLADRASDWRSAIVIGSVASAMAVSVVLVSVHTWIILTAFVVSMVIFGTILPVADAAAVRLAKRTGYRFGTQRAWGTGGYIVLLLVTGLAIGQFGPAAFVWLVVGFAWVRALVSLALPKFRAVDEVRSVRPKGALRSFLKPWFVLPLLGFAMINGSHMILAAFQSLLFARQGFDAETISGLIVIGAVAEVVVFLSYTTVAPRMSARGFMMIAGLAMVFRLAAFGFEPGLIGLIPLQMLHGITFGLGYIAVVTFIANWVPEDNAAEAQSFMVMLQQAMTIVAILGFGAVLSDLGGQAYFVAAGFAAIGVACVVLSVRLKPPVSESSRS